MSANPEGVVSIHGKQYRTVAHRIAEFREHHPELTIETQLIAQDDEKVIMKALILDGDKLIATGYAEEVRGASNINSTSALENAETSAVGRALAFYGLAGTEIASADEVASAITSQKVIQATERLVAHNTKWKEHEDSLRSIRAHCYAGELEAAWEEWNEIPEEDQRILKVAPTKGGWMDKVTKEGLAQAAKDDFDPERGVYKSIADRKDNGISA